MNTWAHLALIWCLLWWSYAAYMLLVPPKGSRMFELHETPQDRVLLVIGWALLVLTAPVWCPLHELFGDNR